MRYNQINFLVFGVFRHILKLFMSSKCAPRKQAYRWHRVKCNECQKEMNADHANTRMKNVHGNMKMKFTPVVAVTISLLPAKDMWQGKCTFNTQV